jgi:hypothetical protein
MLKLLTLLWLGLLLVLLRLRGLLLLLPRAKVLAIAVVHELVIQLIGTPALKM